VTTIAGGVGLVAGVVTGLLAKSYNDQANKVCDGAACTTETGVSNAHTAGTFATVSTITFVGGLALIGAGLTMYFSAPRGASAQAASITVDPQVGTGSAGLSLRGSF
jgi:hypothetical protein